MTEQAPHRLYLREDQIPTQWYNLRADMKNKPAPLMNPGTHQPLTAEEMSGIFCEELVRRLSEMEEDYV